VALLGAGVAIAVAALFLALLGPGRGGRPDATALRAHTAPPTPRPRAPMMHANAGLDL
jgi:hypothetical protein